MWLPKKLSFLQILQVHFGDVCMIMPFNINNLFNLQLGANKIQWTNMITLEKDYMSFLPKKTFSSKWILQQVFLRFVIMNAYSCPNTFFKKKIHFWI
jgi:hypothetical protein